MCCRLIRVSCRWGILPITWDASLCVSSVLGGGCIYVYNCFLCVYKICIFAVFVQIQCLVSLLILDYNVFYCLCMMYLICDTIINNYLLTYFTYTKGSYNYLKFINNELFSPKPTSYACMLQNETLSNSVHLFKRYLATRNFEQQSRAITL